MVSQASIDRDSDFLRLSNVEKQRHCQTRPALDKTRQSDQCFLLCPFFVCSTHSPLGPRLSDPLALPSTHTMTRELIKAQPPLLPITQHGQRYGSAGFAFSTFSLLSSNPRTIRRRGNMAESLTTREGCHLILHLKASASNIPGCSRHAPTSSPLHLRALYSPMSHLPRVSPLAHPHTVTHSTSRPRLALRLILPHQNRGLRSLKSLPTPKGNRVPPLLMICPCP